MFGLFNKLPFFRSALRPVRRFNRRLIRPIAPLISVAMALKNISSLLNWNKETKDTTEKVENTKDGKDGNNLQG